MLLDRDLSALGDLPGYGSENAIWAIVGPEPSEKRKDLHPFGDRSLEMITRVARQLDQDDLYFTNLANRVPEKKTSKMRVADVRHYYPSLVAELKAIGPRRILAVGVDVAKALIPDFQDMREDHGAVFPGDHLGFDCEIIPTFMFQTAAQNPEMLPILQNDLKRFFTQWDFDEIPEFTCITRINQLPKLSGQVVVDIETSGLDLNCSIHYIGISDENGNYWILESPQNKPGDEENAENIKPIKWEVIKGLGTKFVEDGIEMICHNTAFELFQFVGHDPFKDTSDWQYVPTIDTMLLAHNEGTQWNLRLKHLTSYLTNLPGSHAGGGVYDREYLALDLISTWRIYKTFEQELYTYSGQLMADMSGIYGCIRARGVPINQKLLNQLYEETQEEVNQSEKRLADTFGNGVNWGSPTQVVDALKNYGIKLTTKTKAGKLSVAEAVLEELAESYPEVRMLLEYRTKQKLLSGFIAPYVEANSAYMYPSIMLHGAETGRTSCRNPNLQQIPRTGMFKTIFTSRWDNGHFFLVDLDQAELRVAAILSGDTKFAEALLAEDAHRAIAAIVFNKPPEEIDATERKASKAITFGTLYGGTARGLAARAGIPVERAEHVQRELFGQFPGLKKWADGIHEWCRFTRDPLIWTTPFGRKRDLTKIRRFEDADGVYRKAINTDPQSLASDTMLSISRSFHFYCLENDLKSRLMFNVHDSAAGEVYPGEEEAVIAGWQHAFATLRTPLDDYPLAHILPHSGEILIGESWAACESTSDYYNVKWSGLCKTSFED